jgi:hypothetical protein
MFHAKIRPQSLDREQTVWYHGGDASNHLRVFLTTDGRLAFEVIEQGNVRLTLQTPTGLLSTNQTQTVTVQQTHDRWFLWIGNELAAATTNLFTIQAQNGPLLLGCSPTAALGAMGDYYGGLMDDVFWVILGYAQTVAIPETVAFSGGALAIYGHNETYVPSELWRLAFQAWHESGLNVSVTNLNGAISRLLGSSTLAVGDYWLSEAWQGTNDFRLRPDSPCVAAADPSAVVGIPGLRDLAGNPITDGTGNLLISGLDIGPYESAFDHELLAIALLPAGQIRLQLPAVVRAPCLFEESLDLKSWFPLATNTAPANGFFEWYGFTGTQSNSFYRAHLVP